MTKLQLKNPTLGDIFRFIYEKKGTSRKQIAENFYLSLPTATSYLQDLIDNGLIMIDGTFTSTGGRKANTYVVVPSAAYSIGVDITRTHCTVVLIDIMGNIIEEYRARKCFRNSDDYYQQIADKIDELLESNSIDKASLVGVGIALPAIIDKDLRTISYAKVIDLPSDAYKRISSIIHYPVSLFNDANSAGLAEWWVTDSDKLALYLSLKQSIGGATIDNRTIFVGDNSRASEFGHLTVVPGGKRCYCGQKGCVDAYLSEFNLTNFTNGDLAKFFDDLPYNQGYRDILDSYLEYLALVANTLRMCYDSDIIIGGNVGVYFDQYIDDLKEHAIKLNPFETSADYIKPCAYKTSASAVGAGLFLIKAYMDSM